MANYAPEVPKDKNGNPLITLGPPKTAYVATNRENASSSSILLLSDNTSEIEIMAVGQHVAGMWLSRAEVDSSVAATSVLTAAGSANFDFMVPNGTVRFVVVPRSTVVADYGSMMGINRANGLMPAIAFKTLTGNGSVLTAEL